jgi:hypothetical protein
MYRCGECDQPTGGVTLGFNERRLRPQWVCAPCFRDLGASFKSAECRLTPEEAPSSRHCIVAKGHAHIHTSQGPLYPDSRGIPEPKRGHQESTSHKTA